MGRIDLISKYNKYEGVCLFIYHWLIIMEFLGTQSCLQEDNLLLKKEKYSELESQTFILPTHTPTACLFNTWIETFECRAHTWGVGAQASKSYTSVFHKDTQQEVTTKLTRKRFVTSYPTEVLIIQHYWTNLSALFKLGWKYNVPTWEAQSLMLIWE